MSGSCPICGGGARALGDKSGFPMARCRGCRHLFVDGTVDSGALDEVYRRYSYDRNDLEHVPGFVIDRLRQVIAPFGSARRNGRLLDVGFGAGALLKVAREQNWRPYGIEMSALAVEQAKQNGFPDVIAGDFLAAPWEDGFFDVIVMTELVEHLPEPRPFLRQAKRLLSPGGLLYLTTPNGQGLSGRLLGIQWSAAAPPEHLHLFSPRSLGLLLAAEGFGDVKILAEGVNPYELVERARALWGRRSDPGFDRVSTGYQLNEKMVSNRLGSSVKRIANQVLSAARLGDYLKIYARRPS
jgi:2-polyprenyl-3-methyl-5-hydroxy-6-metoxy-1,4-benzoquinol methylase